MFRGFWKWFNNARAVVLAVVVHIIVLGVLIMNMEWTNFKPAAAPKSAPIQTKTVDPKLIKQELSRIQDNKKKKAAKEKRRLAKIEKDRKAEIKRKKDLVEKKQRADKIKKAENLKREKELVAKKKREDLAKARAEAIKKKAQDKVAAAKREKALAAAAEKKRIAEELRRLDSIEKQRQQKHMEELSRQEMEDEENESKIAYYSALIKSDVQKEWRFPPTARKGMQCSMLIRLLPSGEVLSVQITRSSGSKAFDDAAERAVRKASPLPVSISSAGKLFEKFRELDFLFNPENI